MSAYENKQKNEFIQELLLLKNSTATVDFYVSGFASPIRHCELIDKDTYITELSDMFKDINFKPATGNYLYLRTHSKELYKLKWDTVIGFAISSDTALPF